MGLQSGLLIFATYILLLYQINTQFKLQSLCDDPQVHRYLDISSAKIQKSKSIYYRLSLYDSEVQVNRSKGSFVLHGNFSRLSIKNTQTKKDYIYEGVEMTVKIPANHVFNLQKIPELEIQINYQGIDLPDNYPIRYLILSQLYVVSQFTTKIQTILHNHLQVNIQDGDIIQTSRLVKTIEGFPMLMYRGTSESYPCRSDLLCFVKRQYQLISEEDFRIVKGFISQYTDNSRPKKAFRRKSLYEVYPFKKKVDRSIDNDEL